MTDTKRCPKCSRDVPLDQWNASHSRRVGGTQSYCKACMKLIRREYLDRNREKILARKREKYQENKEAQRERARRRSREHPEAVALASRKWYLRTKYGLTLDQYEAMVAERGGRCDICGKVAQVPPGRKVPLHVDHCHTSGAVRGLLCTPCNTALGSFNDDPDILRSAIEYLARDPLL